MASSWLGLLMAKEPGDLGEALVLCVVGEGGLVDLDHVMPT